MTQQPFSRPGAVDLSAFKRPAQPSPSSGAPAGSAGGGAAGGAYSVAVTEENFQTVVESSMTAPVILVLYSGGAPETQTYADDVSSAAASYEGRFLVGTIDTDTAPGIAQALQVQQLPVMLVLLDGRPVTQPIPGVLTPDEVSTLLNQLGQQLTAQGVTGRHQPQAGSAAPSDEDGVDEGPAADPRYAAAQQALEENDIDRAVAEYQKLVDANPADGEAAAGLAMAKVLQRTADADLEAARQSAAANPDDLAAQTLVADLDLLGGHVDDAFDRLIAFIRGHFGDERNAAREHLLGLFAAVGNDDPRVAAARQGLASALF